MVRTHKDLDVWKRAIDFVTSIYKITEGFPKSELYGLTSQIRRASVSIPSNIAEGATRKGKNEFRQFLYISLSSGAEVDTQLIIAKNLNYISVNDYNIIAEKLSQISKMTQGLIKSITKN